MNRDELTNELGNKMGNVTINEPIESENIVCPYCGYEHCDLRDNEAPTDNFKCDKCSKIFSVAEITKTFYETTRNN